MLQVSLDCKLWSRQNFSAQGCINKDIFTIEVSIWKLKGQPLYQTKEFHIYYFLPFHDLLFTYTYVMPSASITLNIVKKWLKISWVYHRSWLILFIIYEHLIRSCQTDIETLIKSVTFESKILTLNTNYFSSIKI